jgi:RND superfamily putative drug exporter
MAKNAVRNAVNTATSRVNHPPAGDAQRFRRPAPPSPSAPREEREIESWLGELRGTAPAGGPPAPPPPRPSADATRAMPEQRPRPPRPQPGNEPTTAFPALGTPPQDDDATTAIPTPRKQDPDATEKIDTREEDEHQRRGTGGGVSAQDLLRREGRL